jgi:hypothetical protein
VGLLLFIIYINNIPLSIKHISKVILFADNIRPLVTAKNYEQFKQKANSAMFCSGLWFDKNQLVLNLVKFRPTNPVMFL